MSAPEVQLLEPLILFFLIADVGADGVLVPADRVHEEPAGPEVLTHEVALALSIDSTRVDRALALDEPHDLRHRVFRRDRQQHVHMVGHQMPFLDLRFLLERELPEHFPKMPTQFLILRFPSALRNEDHMIFSGPGRVV